MDKSVNANRVQREKEMASGEDSSLHCEAMECLNRYRVDDESYVLVTLLSDTMLLVYWQPIEKSESLPALKQKQPVLNKQRRLPCSRETLKSLAILGRLPNTHRVRLPRRRDKEDNLNTRQGVRGTPADPADRTPGSGCSSSLRALEMEKCCSRSGCSRSSGSSSGGSSGSTRSGSSRRSSSGSRCGSSGSSTAVPPNLLKYAKKYRESQKAAGRFLPNVRTGEL